MISKQCSCDIIDNLETYSDSANKLSDLMNQHYENPFIEIIDNILEALVCEFNLEDFDDQEPLIFSYVYTHQFGKDYTNSDFITIDGVVHNPHNSKELYDLLIELKSMRI